MKALASAPNRRRVKAAALALFAIAILAACTAMRAPRLAAPLSYAPVAPAPDEAFRATPPPEGPLDTSPTFALSTARLDNGVEIVLVERHGLPVFTSRLVLLRGGRDLGRRPELLDLAAAAVVREHEGSASASADLRPDVDCDPDRCEAAVSGLIRSFDAGLRVLADLAVKPQFPAWQLALVQRDWKTFTDRMGSGPESAVGHNERSLLFPPNDPYSPISPQDRGALASVTMNDLAFVYGQVFQPQHATLIVAGDTAMPELRAAAQRAFGGWVQSRPFVPQSLYLPPFPGAQGRTILVDERTTLVHAYVVARGPIPSDPSLDALSVLAMLLSTPKGQLSEEVRSNMNATYDISASIAIGRVGSWWEIGGAFELDKAVPAVATLLAAVRRARDQGVSPADLEGARTRFIAGQRSATGTTSGVTAILSSMLHRGLPASSALTRPGRVAKLTTADLQRAAQTWLADGALRLIVVGPRKWIQNQFEGLGIGAVEWRNRRGEGVR